MTTSHRLLAALATVVVTVVATGPVLAQQLYDGPQLIRPFHTDQGMPGTGVITTLSAGDLDGDGVQDLAGLRGSAAFVLLDPANFHAADTLFDGAAAICIHHDAALGDQLLIANENGIWSWDLATSTTTLELATVKPVLGMKEVRMGSGTCVAAWSSDTVTLYERSEETGLIESKAYTVSGVIDDVAVCDMDLEQGLEVAVLTTGTSGALNVFYTDGDTPAYSFSTGGIDSFVDALVGSATGGDLLVFKSDDETWGECVNVFNSLQWGQPLGVAGLGVTGGIVGDYFGAGESYAVFASGTGRVYPLHHNDAEAAWATGYELYLHPNPQSTAQINLPGSEDPAVNALVPATADFDGDGDMDLFCTTVDGSGLHFIPGEVINAEDQRIKFDYSWFEMDHATSTIFEARIDPIGLDGTVAGAVLPTGATDIEMTVWRADSLGAPIGQALGKAYMGFGPGQANTAAAQFNATFPMGATVFQEQMVFQIRTRAVERIGGTVVRTWPSRHHAASMDPSTRAALSNWPLPLGWAISLSGEDLPDGTGGSRTGGSGPTPPGGAGGG